MDKLYTLEDIRIAYRQGFIDAIAKAYDSGLAQTKHAADAMEKHQPRPYPFALIDDGKR